MSDSRERLQKVLARAGVGSRRAVEGLIAARRVSINGTIARLGDRVDPGKDKVEVDGSLVQLATDLAYYLMNKPAGVVTSAHDPDGRPTVTDLVEVGTRLWPVGRLDMDTEGALLLTNDGELTHRLTHPRHGVPKTYLAEVGGTVGRRALAQLRAGVLLEDGPTAPAEAHVVERLPGASLVEVTVTAIARSAECSSTSVTR